LKWTGAQQTPSAHVTGTKLGRRSLKFVDMASWQPLSLTWKPIKLFRVVSKEEARDLAPVYAPEVSGKARQQLLAYQRMPDSLLFTVQKAEVPRRRI